MRISFVNWKYIHYHVFLSFLNLFSSLFFQTVKCLLIYPNPESALNEEAGRLLLEQYSEYSKQAKMMTEIYARSSKIISNLNKQDGSTSSSSTSSSTQTKTNNISKKRAAEKIDKKKQENKRALKRLWVFFYELNYDQQYKLAWLSWCKIKILDLNDLYYVYVYQIGNKLNYL